MLTHSPNYERAISEGIGCGLYSHNFVALGIAKNRGFMALQALLKLMTTFSIRFLVIV